MAYLPAMSAEGRCVVSNPPYSEPDADIVLLNLLEGNIKYVALLIPLGKLQKVPVFRKCRSLEGKLRLVFLGDCKGTTFDGPRVPGRKTRKTMTLQLQRTHSVAKITTNINFLRRQQLWPHFWHSVFRPRVESGAGSGDGVGNSY